MNTIELMSKKSLNEVMPIVLGMINMQFQNIGAIPGLFGDPGIGKTAMIQEMCSKYNYNLLDIHYGLKPLEEISGLPDFGQTIDINGINIKKTHWTLPDILGDAYELSKNGKPLVIFLDDFHTASPGNMALGYEMFTSKKLRGYPFPQNTAFILAANVSGSKSLATPIPSPIINRVAAFNVHVDFDYWKSNYAIPNKINSKIIGFLSNPKYRKYFQSEEIVNKPWSSARSWTNFSTLLSVMEQYNKEGLNSITPYYLALAFVDEEAAINFSQYYALFSEVDIKDIFDNNKAFELPEDLQKRYVIILACLDEFITRYTESQDIAEKVNLILLISKILIITAKTASELAVVGLKELILVQNSLNLKIYQQIEKQLYTLDSEIAQKILNDINELI